MSTLAGGNSALAGYLDAVGSLARFNQPTAVAMTISGDVMVADSNNNVIRKVSSTGDGIAVLHSVCVVSLVTSFS